MLLHGKHLAFETVFAHGENPLLHFVEQVIDLVLLFVRATHALGGGRNDLAQNVFVANDFEVVPDVRCRRNEREQLSYEHRAADAIEEVPIAEHLCERDQVNALSGVPKIDKNVVDGSVRRDIEIFLVNFLDAFRDCFTRRDEH